MSVALLSQTFDETRRLAIAGSMVAPGDFRLKKLAPSLQQAGSKSPVFARIGEAVTAVVDSNERSAAPALLGLSTLINAVLYTQGETGKGGTLQPIERIDVGIAETQATARMLKPLLEALTSTGSGRLEIVRDGFERGEFRDLRLIRPAVAGLEDVYGELADYIADKVLPAYGKAVLPQLVAKYDPKGKTGDARRLKLIATLDPALGRELMLKTLAEGNRDTKLVAVSLLGDNPEDVPLLLEQLKQKGAAAVRQASISGLSRSSEPAAVAALSELLEQGKETQALSGAIKESRNPVLVAKVIEQLPPQLQTLKTTKFKTSKEADELTVRIHWLLDSLQGNPAADVEAFLLELWNDRDSLAQTKGNSGGEVLVHQIAGLMSQGPDNVKRRLIGDHERLEGVAFVHAVRAAFETLPPAEFFNRFSSYLTDPAATKKGKKSKGDKLAADRQEMLINHLVQARYNARHAWMLRDMDEMRSQASSMDPRWLDLAVDMQDLSLAHAFARPGHNKLDRFLTDAFQALSKRSASTPYDTAEVLHTMVMIRHPEAVDSLIAAIQSTAKGTQHHYSVYWYGRLIEALPPEQAPRFEELLATLPEKFADQLVGAVSTLKLKAAEAARTA